MDGERIDYGTWGEQFFIAAITEERVLGAVKEIADKPIAMGPIGVGPGGIAKVRANGTMGEPTITRHEGEPITFDVRLTISLRFSVDLRLDKEWFDADLSVPLRLTALALDGVRILIDADPPRSSDIELDLQADGSRAKLLDRVAGVGDELRKFVAVYVKKELDSPAGRKSREIDVAKLIADSWE